MEVETKIIDITPDKSLMPKISFSGYSVKQAISELVDNSVDAKLDEEELLIEIIVDPDYILVKDNGKGMDEAEASNCLKLAYSTKQDQLGEFGLGLKTAAQSLGKRFVVITKQSGINKRFIIKYDEDEWDIKSSEWKHPMHVDYECDMEEHGTSVRIDKLKIKYYPNLVTNLKDELGMRYAPFIKQGLIRIKVNRTFCEPQEPDLTSEGKTQFDIKLNSGYNIRGWIGLVRNPGGAGNKGYYGFNTFRRGRLITQYEQVGFNPHPTVRRIIGELHMDHVPVTHNKREWIKEHALYKEVEEAMKEYIKPFLVKARKYDEQHKIDKNTQEKMEQQLETIAKAINRNPELKQYSLPSQEILDKNGNKERVEIYVEKREPDPEPVMQIQKEPELDSTRTRNPKKIHRIMTIKIAGKRYKFKHTFMDLGDRETLRLVNFDTEKGLEVYTNTGFPAFTSTRDFIFYGTWNVAEALAECMAKEKNEPKERVFELRNIILRETAQIMQDLEELDKIEKEEMEQKKKKEEIEKRIAGNEGFFTC